MPSHILGAEGQSPFILYGIVPARIPKISRQFTAFASYRKDTCNFIFEGRTTAAL